MDVRSRLTAQFLMAAAMQARAAAEIESRPEAAVTEDGKVAHRGFVIGAIMQGTAALECEVWGVMVYGPGHHLGSNGIDSEARDFLAPVAEVVDGEGVLERYRVVLHLLRKKAMDQGAQPWQDAPPGCVLRELGLCESPRSLPGTARVNACPTTRSSSPRLAVLASSADRERSPHEVD